MERSGSSCHRFLMRDCLWADVAILKTIVNVAIAILPEETGGEMVLLVNMSYML